MPCVLSPVPIVLIVGPTAVGKSAVAVDLARHLSGEIISCDAMQVYREAVISTDRPSFESQQGVAHHLLGHVSVEDEFNVALYRDQAIGAIEEVRGRHKTPIVCGGSGMYVMALLDGLLEGGVPDPEVRRRIEAEADQKGLADLYRRLQSVDPRAAQKIKPADRRRIVRALEVFESSGAQISRLQGERSGLWGRQDVRIFALDRERETLYRRAESRIDEMVRRGLVDEVKSLLKKRLTPSSARIIGVPELGAYFSGENSLEGAIDLMKQNTRRYIKRQLTWFRRDKRLEWVQVAEQDSSQDIAQKILRLLVK